MLGFFSNQNNEYIEILRDLYGIPVENSSRWWVKDPKRAVEEIYLMDENTNARVNECGCQLKWTETITTNFGTDFEILIEAQDNHPFSAPEARVLSPSISGAIHRYNGGNLCLFRPEEYTSRMKILDIRNQACAWCFAYEAYKHTGEWPAGEASH